MRDAAQSARSPYSSCQVASFCSALAGRRTRRLSRSGRRLTCDPMPRNASYSTFLRLGRRRRAPGCHERRPQRGSPPHPRLPRLSIPQAVCFDVDSTVCVDEGIDELAAFMGAGEAVAALTAKAPTADTSPLHLPPRPPPPLQAAPRSRAAPAPSDTTGHGRLRPLRGRAGPAPDPHQPDAGEAGRVPPAAAQAHPGRLPARLRAQGAPPVPPLPPLPRPRRLHPRPPPPRRPRARPSTSSAAASRR